MMKNHELSAVENYTIGALTGLAEVIATNPLFVIKTKIQQNKSWILGPASYYRGVTTNALGFMPGTAIQVGANQWIQSNIFNQPTNVEKMVSAFTAGVISSGLSCPIEKIMTLQNDQPSTKISTLLNGDIKKNLFTGQLATALREGGFSIFFLAAPPVIKDKLTHYDFNDASSSLIAAVSSGISASLVTQPFDTIKTTQQSSTNPLSFFHTAKNLGCKGLFKGLLARSSSVIISISLMDWVKTHLEDWCIEQHHAAVNSKIK
jgi:Mitochondrial carrier protein